LALVRWLLHHVLPFPCFLWDHHYLASRFRVTPASLKAALENPKTISALAPVTYKGILHDFLGPRWWRAGVEQLLWEWTGGLPFDLPALRKALKKHVSARLVPVDIVQPVVCIDTAFRPSDTLVDVADAVEIQPDEWPSYAEQAWITTKEAAADEDLRALVVAKDRERVDALRCGVRQGEVKS
jgi:hypothetical protein